jgi:hypothetical protein
VGEGENLVRNQEVAPKGYSVLTPAEKAKIERLLKQKIKDQTKYQSSATTSSTST